jgi:glycosyltransferase involved in cell wall biosynthesis
MLDPRKPDFSNTPASPHRPASWHLPRNAHDAARAPQVSIITPFYNISDIFHETARCVLAQTFQQFEWLIVNDKSTNPASLAILDHYRSLDPRVRVIDRDTNGGLSAARNTAYAAARSDIVYQVDADDLAEPTYVEKCLWFLRTNPQYAFVKSFTSAFEGQTYPWFQGFEQGPRFLQENLVHVQALIRKSAWQAVGGFDEANRGGLEDWEFWLACAEKNLWGATIPELLEWYRRRPNNQENWPNWSDPAKREAFVKKLHDRYPRIFASAKNFPSPAPHWPSPFEAVPHELPLTNPLAPKSDDKRLLLILPWMTMGGADRYNVRLVQQLCQRGWQITIACTTPGDYSWLPDFAKLTSDIHILPNIARPAHQPAYLRYLIESRSPSCVLLTGSELAYRVLPYLRSVCPQQAYLDYCHIEEENWKNGGHPRSSAGLHDLLECAMVTSQHLKRWEVQRGGDARKVEVVTINEDPASFDVSQAARQRARAKLGISEGERVVLFAGRLTQQKQPAVLAGALRSLLETGLPSGAPIVALIAGEGPDRALVERELSRWLLPPQPSTSQPNPSSTSAPSTGSPNTGALLKPTSRVHMLGSVPADDMPALYAACDLLFLPSEWEGISLAIYEAFAAGRACLAADVGGQRELVTPETGLLLPRSTRDQEIAAYAHALRTLLADSQCLARMGAAARERIERHFSLHAMGERVQSLLLASVAKAKQETCRAILPTTLAHELATQAVELQRVHALAEHLWHDNQRLQAGARSAPASSALSPSADPRHAAAQELAHIENSRLWRTVQGIKRNPMYDTVASARWGKDWKLLEAKDTPQARLERIKASRTYRLIQTMKTTPLYRAYAKRKYGS